MASFGIILTGGPYQTQRWETACRIADAALDRSDKVTFFLFLDGIYNALGTQVFPMLEKLPMDSFKGAGGQGSRALRLRDLQLQPRARRRGRLLPRHQDGRDSHGRDDGERVRQAPHAVGETLALTIYLIDEPFAEVGLAYAANDPESRVVLLQDAVYLAQKGRTQGRIYAIGDDVARRGLTGSIDPAVRDDRIRQARRDDGDRACGLLPLGVDESAKDNLRFVPQGPGRERLLRGGAQGCGRTGQQPRTTTR